MIPTRAIWVFLLAALVGCADGGPVGSGISASTVSGNVIEVEASSGGAATLAVPLVASIEEAPDVQDDVDAEGNFELTGDFSGRVTVRFTGSGVDAETSVDVPEGSTVQLDDVTIRAGNAVTVGFAEVRNFIGRIFLRDCRPTPGFADLLVNDLRRIANQFLVRVTPNTLIVDRFGNLLGCSQINVQVVVAVRGRVGRTDGTVDGTIEAIAIIIDPPPPGDEQPVEQRNFKGFVTQNINCRSDDIIIIDEKIGETRLRFNSSSSVVGNADQPVRCQDIVAGDRVSGRGVIFVRDPNLVDVIRMVVSGSGPGPGPGPGAEPN